jgi:hypothetical protein
MPYAEAGGDNLTQEVVPQGKPRAPHDAATIMTWRLNRSYEGKPTSRRCNGARAENAFMSPRRKASEKAWRSLGSPTPNKAVWGRSPNVPVWRDGDQHNERGWLVSLDSNTWLFLKKLSLRQPVEGTYLAKIPKPTWRSFSVCLFCSVCLSVCLSVCSLFLFNLATNTIRMWSGTSTSAMLAEVASAPAPSPE